MATLSKRNGAPACGCTVSLTKNTYQRCEDAGEEVEISCDCSHPGARFQSRKEAGVD